MATLESGFGNEDVANKAKLNTSSSNDLNIPNLQWLTKIVSELQSNDEEMKNKMAQLTGRVSRLESLTPFEAKHSAYGNKNRNERQISNNMASIVMPACATRACAFDYGTNNSIGLGPACTIKACAFDYVQDKWVKSTIPKNCKDLQDIGHVLNGFYSVLKEGKIQLVFCNFNPPKVQGFSLIVIFFHMCVRLV